jgi:hypothetical protein
MEVPGLPPLDWTHGAGEARWQSSVLTLEAARGVDRTNDASISEAFQHGATSSSFVPNGDRLFRLHSDLNVRAVFMAQAPLGNGCVAHFSDLHHASTTLADLRDGS